MRFTSMARKLLIGAALAASAMVGGSQLGAAEKEAAVVRDYSLVRAAPAPRTQDWVEAESKSAGCQSCHTESDAHTMHRSPAVVLGCADCHGGNPSVRGDPSLPTGSCARHYARLLRQRCRPRPTVRTGHQDATACGRHGQAPGSPSLRGAA